jgi:hypothetical protein
LALPEPYGLEFQSNTIVGYPLRKIHNHEAGVIFKEVFEQTVLGPEHPHTLTSMDNLASTWDDGGGKAGCASDEYPRQYTTRA